MISRTRPSSPAAATSKRRGPTDPQCRRSPIHRTRAAEARCRGSQGRSSARSPRNPHARRPVSCTRSRRALERTLANPRRSACVVGSLPPAPTKARVPREVRRQPLRGARSRRRRCAREPMPRPETFRRRDRSDGSEMRRRTRDRWRRMQSQRLQRQTVRVAIGWGRRSHRRPVPTCSQDAQNVSRGTPRYPRLADYMPRVDGPRVQNRKTGNTERHTLEVLAKSRPRVT